MTAPSASIQALRSLGYTNGESEFLYLVAIHSGYFTHRQYLMFSQIKPGYVSHEFTAKLFGKNTRASTRTGPVAGSITSFPGRSITRLDETISERADGISSTTSRPAS